MISECPPVPDTRQPRAASPTLRSDDAHSSNPQLLVVPDLVPHLYRGLSPALARPWAPATHPYLAECFRGWSLASAAHAGLPLAVVAGADPGLPVSVEEEFALGLTSARSRLPFAAAVRGRSLAPRRG